MDTSGTVPVPLAATLPEGSGLLSSGIYATGYGRKTEMTETDAGTEVARTSLFTDDQLSKIDGFASAAAMLQAAGVEAESMADYGTGFTVSKDNDLLVGMDFLILSWRFNHGAYGEDFVSAEIVTKHNEKLILNDGSTGICKQLRVVTDQRTERGHQHPYAGLIVKNGLTVSKYFYNEKTGEISRVPKEGKDWTPASTYYLAE